MTKEVGSLVVQLCGLCVVVIFACLHRNKKAAMTFGAIVMFLANIIGQIGLAGGGPGACVGIFFFPLLGIMVAWVTFIISNFVRNKFKGANDGEK